MNRKFSFMAVVLGTSLLAGCHGGKEKTATSTPAVPTTKTIVILLDKTASVKDQNGVFKTAIRKIVGSMKGGDTLRLAEITGASSADFDFVVRTTLPKDPVYNALTTNMSEYRDAVAKLKEERKKMTDETIAKIDDELAKKPTAMTTDLFGAITTAGLYLSERHNNKYLVILSDMIEEDSNWRFNHVRWTTKLTDKIIKKEKDLGLIANLKNVNVYVVGARGANLSVMQHIRFFWAQYFKLAQANFNPAHYAHALLEWNVK